MATILIVDDEAGFRRSTAQVLGRAGHQCIEAANGKEALAVLRRHKIDLVVLDLMMPDFDGIETLRELRRANIEVPVLLVAGTWGEGLQMYAGFGANACLAKPFDATDLLNKVESLLAGRSKAVR